MRAGKREPGSGMVKRAVFGTGRMTGKTGRTVPCVPVDTGMLAIHGRLVVIMAIDTGVLEVTGRVGVTLRTRSPDTIMLS